MTRSAVANRTLASRNNSILYNGDFEQKPSVLTAQTNTSAKWIDGTTAGNTAKLSYGWGMITATSSAAAGFDTSTAHSGTTSMKLSTLNSTGAALVGSYRVNAPTAASAYELFRLAANTSYTLSGYVKTNNAATNGAFLQLRQYSASFTNLATTVSSKLSGTQDWTLLSLTVTTSASAVFGIIFLSLNVTGNVSDAWFDDLVLTRSISRSSSGSRPLVS